MTYKQLPLSELQSEIELWLIAKLIGNEKRTTILARVVEKFILEYARYAMRIADPIANPAIGVMFEVTKALEWLDLNPIKVIK